MDSNGTRYHLVLGEDDWTRRTLAEPLGSVAYDGDRGELTLRSQPFRFDQRPGDRPPRLSDRRGAALDRFGNLYWIDVGGRSIRVQSAGSGTPSLFWEPGLHAAPIPDRTRGEFAPPPEAGEQPPAPATLPLAGLAVTEDHFLAVGTLAPKGLLVFDLHAPAPPRQALWPEDVDFAPFDLCARSDGGVFVLDRDHAALWELDRRFLVVSRRAAHEAPAAPDFAPAEPGPAPPPAPAWSAHRRIAAADATPIGGDPIAVERAPSGRVLVLDRNEAAPPSSVRLLDPGAPAGPSARLEEVPEDGPPVQIVAHDMALVANGDLGTLFVADRDGNQAYAFTLALHGDTLTARLAHDFFPMRVFGGKALVAGDAGALYDFGDGWIPLVRQRRPRFAVAATLYTPVLDGRQPGTVWHRLLLDGCIPPEASVAVESRAADDERELAGAPWQPEPRLAYRRSDGPELPFAQPGATGLPETWELLFQRARGRYLELRLQLAGDGRSTPRLRALRAYYPRFSYLDRYLPGVYREDAESASFLDRFLANLEGIQTGIEDRIGAAQALFDPRTAPAETLDWLLGWFDFASDPTWHEERRRLFLRHAMEFFALRGTVPGIQLALRLALDPGDDEQLFAPETARRRTSRIVERYRTRTTPAVALGDPTDLSGPRIVVQTARWDPTQGRDALTDRWREAIGDADAEFPLDDPSEGWRAFVREVLGIEPPGPFDPALWTGFLRTRYGRVETLNAAYGLAGGAVIGSFEDLGFPAALPADGAPLRDWYQFVALVLPARRAAHRFTVLLPMPPQDAEGRSPEERRAIAERVVELQKPAHTTFDLRFFWAAFRLGEARLGEDTLLDLGSRDPRLRQPVVLGREHAGESYLGGEPGPAPDEVGRNPLNR